MKTENATPTKPKQKKLYPCLRCKSVVPLSELLPGPRMQFEPGIPVPLPVPLEGGGYFAIAPERLCRSCRVLTVQVYNYGRITAEPVRASARCYFVRVRDSEDVPIGITITLDAESRTKLIEFVGDGLTISNELIYDLRRDEMKALRAEFAKRAKPSPGDKNGTKEWEAEMDRIYDMRPWDFDAISEDTPIIVELVSYYTDHGGAWRLTSLKPTARTLIDEIWAMRSEFAKRPKPSPDDKKGLEQWEADRDRIYAMQQSLRANARNRNP